MTAMHATPVPPTPPAPAVFMGMGEPLLNIHNVVEAVAYINKTIGIGARSITISTVGVPGQLERLAQHQLQCVLAVSLHAPNQDLRYALTTPRGSGLLTLPLFCSCRSHHSRQRMPTCKQASEIVELTLVGPP